MAVATKKQIMCPCGAGPFRGSHGLSMHNIRKHKSAGKQWGRGSGEGKPRPATSTTSKASPRELLREVLSENPDGCSPKDMLRLMRRKGYKGSGSSANYVTSMAIEDATIKRISRGIYGLKNPGVSVEAVAVPAVAPEPTIKDLPKEALLVVIEEQAKKIQALQGLNRAHNTFVTEVTS